MEATEEESLKKRKKIRFRYLQLDLSTYQGKITVGFLVNGIIALTLLIVTSVLYNQIIDKTEKITVTLLRANEYASGMLSELSYQVIAPVKRDSLSLDRAAVYMDSLSAIMNRNDFVEISILENDIRNKFLVLKEYMEANPYHSELQEISFKETAKVYELVRNMSNIISQKIEETTRELNFKKKGLWGLIFLQLIVAGFVSIAVAYFIIRHLTRKIVSVTSFVSKLKNGGLPNPHPELKDEFQLIISPLNSLLGNLKNIRAFAKEVGGGDFDSDVSVFDGKGDLGGSLAEMRDSLKVVAEEARSRQWVNDGINKLSEVIRQHNDNLKTMGTTMLSHMVDYTGAAQAAFFVKRSKIEESEEEYLELISWYAYGREKIKNKQILPGEGLVGQCFQERKSILMKKVPPNYSKIASALGETEPKSLMLYPLIYEDQILGTIELLYPHDYREIDQQFIEQGADIIASSLSSVIGNEQMKQIVDESRQQTEQLQAQEELMRQNAEEIEATQEELKRQMKESESLRSMYESMIESSGGALYRTQHDTNWTKLFISKTVDRLVGFSAEDILSGRVNLLQLVNPEQKEEVEKQTLQAISEKRGFDLVYTVKRKDGFTVKIRDKGQPVFEDGILRYIDGVLLPAEG